MRFLLICCVLKTIVYSCKGFQANIIHPQSRLNNEGARLRLKPPSRLNPLSAGDDDNEEPKPTKEQFGGRFINPRIDDIGLPLADSLISGIVAPVSIVFLCATQYYTPTWLIATLPPTSILNSSLRLFPPTLSHGALLAACWLLGALASKSFESEAFSKDYKEVFKRIIQGGAFASGLLVLLTQADLFIEYGRWVQGGESPEIDLRLLKAFAELALDISVEAGWLIFWRIYRATITTV
ncbi:hypothetical protein TrLO_g10224 [Triparma laevis f. longispina]|uniref:Uncharacterized protein n=1 Tax=Triparma laevis f. longispina TaxID=1714387 RepID=A0A9W7C9A6_9STRA|nr:hypothetical protein TrLO_g10224 [Triparma laevis f. longispina]